MAVKKSRILVTGVTGQVGSAVIRQLSADPSLDVRAAVRSPEKANKLGFPTVLFDYDQVETLAPALEGVDRVFMVTGYTVDMLRQSKVFIDQAKKAGVKYIVHLGACGSDDTQVAHYAWHQLVERYIEWSGISYTHLRPEIFMQNLLGYGGASIVDKGVIRHFVGSARLSWVDCDDVATAAAACLRTPEAHQGKTYRLGYDAKTFDDVADALTRVIGQKFTYEARPPKEFLEKVLAAGAEPAYMNCVYSSYAKFTAGDAAGADEVFDNFESITGQKPRLVEDFAQTHAASFKY